MHITTVNFITVYFENYQFEIFNPLWISSASYNSYLASSCDVNHMAILHKFFS